MPLLKIPQFLFVLVATLTPSWAHESETLSPNDLLQRIERAQRSVNTLSTTHEPQWTLWVAVSFSMPKASLLRLATDAGAAQIPMVFRGVGSEPKKEDPQPQAKPKHNWSATAKPFWLGILQILSRSSNKAPA